MNQCWLIVGGGNMGMRHANHLRFLYPQACIIILSFHLDELEDASYVVKTLEDALKFDPKCAIISNAAPQHCEFAKELISREIHVLIEKPLSDSYEKSLDLLNYSQSFPETVVLVGYQLRYKPGFSIVKNNLKAGLLGKIIYAKASVGHFLPMWRPQNYKHSVSAQKFLGGGVLLELSHEFDYIKNIFGMPDSLQCVSGRMSNLEIDVEDVAFSTFHYCSNLVVSISQNMIDQLPHRTLEIIGEKGILTWDLRSDTINIYDHSQRKLHEQYRSGIENSRELYIKEIQHFVKCIMQQEQPQVTLRDACETMKLIDLAKNSSEISKPIQVIE